MVLWLVLIEVEVFLKLFFNSPVVLGAGKGMDMYTACNTGTWTNTFLPKLVHLNDAQQLSLDKLALV